MQVRLADHDAACVSEALHHRRILGRGLSRKDDAARRRHHSGDVDKVFDGDDDALALL